MLAKAAKAVIVEARENMADIVGEERERFKGSLEVRMSEEKILDANTSLYGRGVMNMTSVILKFLRARGGCTW